VNSPGRSLPPLLRQFLFGSLLLVGLCGVTEVVCRLVFHLHYPFDFPIMNPGSVTADLLALQYRFAHVHSKLFFDVPSNIDFIYPAPVAIPYSIFLLKVRLARLLFYSFAVGGVVVAAAPLGRSMIRRGVRAADARIFLALSFLCSIPFWFELKQGNMEIVVFFLIAAAITAFLHGRDWTAAALLGVAGSMKLFPFLLLGLFFSHKKYLKIAFSLAVGVLLTLASLWLIYPRILYTRARLNANFAGFQKMYLLHFLFPEEQAFDHSAWSFIKRFLPHTWSAGQVAPVLQAYLAVAAVAGIVLYFGRIRKLPVVNQVLCLIVASILFTPVSFDYTLIQLYTPWALFVLLTIDCARSGRDLPGLRVALACLLFLCAPISELIVHGATIQAPIKTLLLVALLVIGLRYPFPSPIPPPEAAVA